jgi:hypothetical protein
VKLATKLSFHRYPVKIATKSSFHRLESGLHALTCRAAAHITLAAASQLDHLPSFIMSAMTDASAVAAITLPAAIVAAYTAARAPFSVTLIPDRSLLLHRAYELIDSNTDLLRPLVQQFLRRRDGLY